VIVLGLDTATQATVVGLRMADGSTLTARDDPAPEQHPGHATQLLALADQLLERAGVGWGELERIAVGVGPGRFTGLRVGIATARGLAQSLDAELVGVLSLRALALAVDAQAPAARAGRGVLAVIDARRAEAFAAAYPAQQALARGRGAEAWLEGEIAFPRALAGEQLERAADELTGGAAHDERWLAVGDGALRFHAELERAGVEVASADSTLHLIDPTAICELGARANPVASRERLLPDYRRSPDAALARERSPAIGGQAT
jgi:tRNA threonylcarbamoyladenosine biosynthesis protein TsaB